MQDSEPEFQDKCVRILFIFWVVIILAILWAIAIFYVIKVIDQPVKWDTRTVGIGHREST